MKTAKLLFGCVAGMLCLTQCTDEKLLDDLNTLSNRVENMEATVNTLNENLDALEVLLENNKTIQSYSETDGVYTLVLSDGTEIKLTEGKVGETVIPEISIDENGYWVIDGVAQEIQANGSTPRFRISDSGFWEVTYDGTSYEQVKNVDSDPVSAVPGEGGESGNTFFENVEVSGNTLIVTMKGGQQYSLPIVEGLISEIVTDGEDFDGETMFVLWGGTVTTPVRVKGDNVIVTAPAGWIATVSEPDAEGNATLSVTAPQQPQTASVSTKATADNTSDLVIQVNKGINWAVDKISVRGTVAANTLLEKFEAGRTIDIEGIEINREKYPQYYHITSDTVIDTDYIAENGAMNYGIFFVEDGVSLEFVSTWEYHFDYLAVIGNSGDRTASLKLTGGSMVYVRSLDETGCAAFQNLNIEFTRPFYMDLPTAEGYTNTFSFVFNDCDIRLKTDQPMVTLYSATTQKFVKFSVTDCFIIPENDATSLVGGDGGCTDLGNIHVENNVFYSESNRKFKIVNGQNSTLSDIYVKNNTFYNIIPNSAFLRIRELTGSYVFSNNLLCVSGEMASNGAIFYPNDYADLGTVVTYDGSVVRNAGWRASGTGIWQDTWYGKSNFVTEFEAIENLEGESNSPLETVDPETRTFTPKADYADCGASF